MCKQKLYKYPDDCVIPGEVVKCAKLECTETEPEAVVERENCPNHPPEAPKDSPTVESAPQPEKLEGFGELSWIIIYCETLRSG